MSKETVLKKIIENAKDTSAVRDVVVGEAGEVVVKLYQAGNMQTVEDCLYIIRELLALVVK